jgi:alkylation response protein AidB-like acyl-CoA dehydrogenase
MADRFDLIARKHAVRQQIEQTRRQLEGERAKGTQVQQRTLAQLETQLDQLMAAEYNLRVAIDQSKITR